LKALSDLTGVLVPQPIKIISMNRETLLIMKAVETIDRGPDQWKQIGQALARIHKIKGNYFGFETNGFCGPLYQDNTPAEDWLTFFKERLLIPRLRMAIDSGNLSPTVISKIESLITELPKLCCPEVEPSLLHGDAQQNNFISAANGTYVIDPSVYYGNPEIDLATLDSFQSIPDDVFKAYQEEIPIDSGFFERRYLWRIPLYLAAVALEGPMHMDRLTRAVKKYV